MDASAIILLVIAAGLFLWWREKRSKAQPKEIPFVRGPGLYEVEVKGESHYQANLESLCGPRKAQGEEMETNATLHLENGNRADRNAVRVEIGGKQVGYLSRPDALTYREELKRVGQAKLQVARCNAVIRGGWRRRNGETGHYGVWLDLRRE